MKAGSRTISELCNERQQTLLKQLKNAKNLSEESIHKLRVEIKQFRSLVRLLKVLGKKNGKVKEALKLLEPVFKSAGKIRNASQNIKLLKSLKSKEVKEFKRYLEEEEKKNGKILKKKIRKFDLKKIKKLNHSAVKAFKHLDREKPGVKAGKYVNNLFREIDAHIPDISSDDTFHNIRKKLKDVKTMGHVLEEISPKHSVRGRLEKVKGIEEKIGEWHDNLVLVEEIEKYLDKSENDLKNEKLALMAINLQTWNEEKKKRIADELEMI